MSAIIYYSVLLFYLASLCLCEDYFAYSVEPYNLPVKVKNALSVVLVLDVSETMEYQERIKKLGNATRQWIENLPEGLLLGMVKFSTEADLLSNLTFISDMTRQSLIEEIPSEGKGEGCIGCGVLLALEVLGERRNGVIVLVTDGDNTEPGQSISDVMDQVVTSGAKVVSVGFGDSAPLNDLKKLAMATGGKLFAVSDTGGVKGLLEALNSALELAQTQHWEVSTAQVTHSDFTRSTQLTLTAEVGAESSTSISSSTPQITNRNGTTSDRPTDKEHGTYRPWKIVGIVAAIIGVMALMLTVLLVCRKLNIAQVTGFDRGFYPVPRSEEESRIN